MDFRKTERLLHVYWRRAGRCTKKNWLLVTTAAFVSVALILLVAIRDMETSAHVGDYLAGFAGALAFIWLIASFRQQSRELSLQRRELSLQRNALELQANELSNVSRFSALQHVASIVKSANDRLPTMDPPFNTPYELPTAFVPTQDWKTILESTDVDEVFWAYMKWQKLEAVCRAYLASLCSAARLYFESTNDARIDNSLKDGTFFQRYYQEIATIPYLADYAGTGRSLAQSFYLLERGLKALHLAGVTAIEMSMGENIVEEDAKAELLAFREQHGGPGIAILGEGPRDAAR